MHRAALTAQHTDSVDQRLDGDGPHAGMRVRCLAESTVGRPATPPPSTLTRKQLRWIDEFLIDFNGAAAAVRAGYSVKSARSIAHENTTKPDIQAVLRERQAEMASKLEIRRVDVVKGLLEAFEVARKDCQAAAMIASMREVAKILGYYSPERVTVDVTVGTDAAIDRLNRLTDEELMKIIKEAQPTSP